MNKKDWKIILISVVLIVGGYIGFDLCRMYFMPLPPPVPVSVSPRQPARFAIPAGFIGKPKEFLPRLTAMPLRRAINFTGLPELRSAMKKDPAGLGKAVSRFIEEPEYMQRITLLDDILFRWAGVEKIKPDSRKSEDGINYIGDARRLAFLEKILDKPYRGTHNGTDVTTAPHAASAPFLLDAYKDASSYAGKLLFFHSSASVQFYQSTFEQKKLLSIILAFDTNKTAKNMLSQSLNVDLSDCDNLDKVIKNFYKNYGRTETMLWLEEMNSLIQISGDAKKISKDIKKLNGIIPDIDLRDFGKMITAGTGKADVLRPSSANNIFFARDYNDTIFGGKGDDVYLYRLYDGFDTIIEKGGQDTIYFNGNINPQDIKTDIEAANVILTVKNDIRHGIRIKDFLCGTANQVETLRFTKNRMIDLPKVIAQIIKENKKLKKEVEQNRKKFCPQTTNNAAKSNNE